MSLQKKLPETKLDTLPVRKKPKKPLGKASKRFNEVSGESKGKNSPRKKTSGASAQQKNKQPQAEREGKPTRKPRKRSVASGESSTAIDPWKSAREKNG